MDIPRKDRPEARRATEGLPRACFLAICGVSLAGLVAARAQGQAADPAPAAPPAGQAAPGVTGRKLNLETTDGVKLAAWHYPVADEAARPPVVILIHDLDGSHTSVEPLAKALAQRGIAVVAPDLRGHGASTIRQLTGGEETLDPRDFKKSDLEAITRTEGGRLRTQSAFRGDIECVRNWIAQQADEGRLDIDRLFVAGSGVGCTLAAMWAIADAAWPDIATGPQGRQVRGLVFISPTWNSRGFSISPVLGVDLIRKTIPVLVLAGRDDRDAEKVFDQLKRARPADWFEQRVGRPPAKAQGKKDQPPTLYLLQRDSPVSGDRLAAAQAADPRQSGGDPAALIQGFIGAAAPAAEP